MTIATFKNGNVTVHFEAHEVELCKRAKDFIACAHRLVLIALDDEDILPVTGVKEQSPAGQNFWRLYSFNTGKEYEMTEKHLQQMAEGKTARLVGDTPSYETRAAMLWIPDDDKNLTKK